METDFDSASFIVTFANQDLAKLSTKEWSRLKDNLRAMLHWFPGIPEHDAQLTPEHITTVQKDIAAQLHHFAAANATRGFRPPDGLIWAEPIRTVNVLYFDLTMPGVLRFSVDADLRDAMLVALGVTLSRSGVARLRRCSPCGQVFWAQHGRQIFCSTRCKEREAGRHYREQHREEERLRAQLNYRERIKQQTGMKNPKIQTRQKRAKNALGKPEGKEK